MMQQSIGAGAYRFDHSGWYLFETQRYWRIYGILSSSMFMEMG